MRATPHVLAQLVRELTWPEVRRFAGIGATAYVFTFVIETLVLLCSASVARALGLTWPSLVRATQHGPLLVAVPLWIMALGVVAGYLAVWLDPRARLASAAAVVGFWLLLNVVVLAATRHQPSWSTLLLSLVMAAGATVGGVLRIRAARRAEGGRLAGRTEGSSHLA